MSAISLTRQMGLSIEIKLVLVFVYRHTIQLQIF